MAQAPNCAIAPVLTVIGGQATTLSTDVARYFGKRHDHVLRDIDNLRAQMDEDHLPNFGETVEKRENPSGGAPIESRAYRLTRDGFTLLAMGFTGKRALQFKLAYIDAFNKMEAALLAKAQPAPAPDLTDGPAMQAAHSAVCKYLDDVQSGRQAHWSLPDEVLHGFIAAAMMSERFMLTFDYGQGLTIKTIDRDAYVLPTSRWARSIESGDVYMPPEELARLATACTQAMVRTLKRRSPPVQPPALA